MFYLNSCVRKITAVNCSKCFNRAYLMCAYMCTDLPHHTLSLVPDAAAAARQRLD